MMISRRDVLRCGAAGLAVAGMPSLLRAQPAARIPVGVQLYSVRDFCKSDFDGTLEKIAEMGFEGVEFAGYYQYGADPEGLRKKLDSLKLKAAGTHIGANALTEPALKKTIEFHKTIGCAFLICPGDKRFTDPEKSKEFAELMNKAAEALKPEGLFCGYHNHAQEFKEHEGKTWMDLFAERTTKDVIIQQDAGWTIAAGHDPAAFVKKHPGRVKTTHIKAKLRKGAPEGSKEILGQDNNDWKSLVLASYENGTEWFIVEQEAYPDKKTSLECTKLSLEGFKKILAEAGKS